jgi:hypothetical protein
VSRSNRQNKANGGAAASEYDRFRSEDFSKTLQDVQIYRIRDPTQYFLPYLFENPLYAETLREWFPSMNVGTELARYLIHPVDEIWSEVVDSFSARDPKALSVGLQMRFWVDNGADHMLSCVGPLKNNAHIFVASLIDMRSSISKINPNWKVSQKYHEGTQVQSYHQAKSALHDIFLLSLSDTCVVSSHSTFGYIIMALKGSLCAFASDNFDKEENKKPSCFWPNSHEICFHIGVVTNNNSNHCSDFMNKVGLQINYGRKLRN